MEQPDAESIATLALGIAREAAAVAVAMRADERAGGLAIETKSTHTDLVTAADRAVEARIRASVAAARPNDEVLGEEGGLGSIPNEAARVRWIVDPIDGTTNFVYGHPGWGVSIAVEVDGAPCVGVVVDPTHGDEFVAVVGAGSTRNGRRLRIGPPPPLGAMLLATGFGYAAERRSSQAATLARVLPAVRDIRRMGSAAIDLCSVACARVDAYYEWGLAAWDLAAGAVIAGEAGARVADVDGGPPRPDGRILAAHPARWDELAALVSAEPGRRDRAD